MSGGGVASGDGAHAPLDCATPFDVLLELVAHHGQDEAFIHRSALATKPDWNAKPFDWPNMFNQISHGSIAHLMPDKLYAFTSVAQAEDIPEVSRLTSLDGAFIIGPRMKAVVDRFAIPKSKLFPIGVVLRDPDVREATEEDNYERLGGGAAVEGSHWLWHVYNRYELVDWENSEKKPYWVEGRRDDLPGSPVQRYSMVSNRERLALFKAPYAESGVFIILGLNAVFISPAFAAAMTDAGVMSFDSQERYASAMLVPYHLDLQRYTECQIAKRQGKIEKLPPIRIFDTDIVIENNGWPNLLAQHFRREAS